MTGLQALVGALDVLGVDAYAAGWRGSAAERGVDEDQGSAAAELESFAWEAWRRELAFFVDGGEVVVDGELDRVHAAVERWAAARHFFGAVTERYGADLVGSAELDAARSESERAGSALDSEVRDWLVDGADPPPWPRPRPALLRGAGAPFGVYAAADAELDARVSERVARMVIDSTNNGADYGALVSALVVDSRDGIPGECGSAGGLAAPSRAWWLRRVCEVARGWRGRLWGTLCVAPAPVDDIDWLRPAPSLWDW